MRVAISKSELIFSLYTAIILIVGMTCIPRTVPMINAEGLIYYRTLHQQAEHMLTI